MKTILCILTVGMVSTVFQGCGLALWSTAGIPATEYAVRTKEENPGVAVPITAGLVAAHGGATYLIWAACWPCAVAYLGFSGIYTATRIGLED